VAYLVVRNHMLNFLLILYRLVLRKRFLYDI
jgi:hypothetical protein